MTMKVYESIALVSGEVSKEGISKDHRNQQQGYSFRGIDDVYNALSPLLAKYKLCILPRIISREMVERKGSKGNALFYVTVQAEFDFVSAEDGSRHTVSTFGEAMDSADKATNKAMSAAYKYATMQTFCIPTEGDNDADAVTHEVQPNEKPLEQSRQKQSEGEPKPISAAEQKRKLLEIDNDLVDCHTDADVKRCAAIWQSISNRDGWSRDYKLAAKEKFDAKRVEIANAPAYVDDGFPGSDDFSNHPLMAGE